MEHTTTYFPQKPAGISRQLGFTMLEALVVIGIIAILAGIAVPAFTTNIQSEKVLALTKEFAGAVSIARGSAIQRGQTVVICSSSDDESCGGTWSDGWIVFYDDDKDGTRGTDEDAVLRYGGASTRGTIAVSDSDGSPTSAIGFSFRGATSGSVSISVTSGSTVLTSSITPFGKYRIYD